jgi:hypothetical protein
MPCAGNPAEICGDALRNSVYIATATLIQSDFSTDPPNNTILYGSAQIQDGVCVLTPNLRGQSGSLLVDSTLSPSNAFDAQWDYRAADGNGADGTSFNYGLLSTGGNEGGMDGAALVVSHTSYLSSSWLHLRYNGNTIVSVPFATGDAYKHIHVMVGESNSITVLVDGIVMINTSLSGMNYYTTDKTGWKFGFASRTGADTNRHSIDNLSITFPALPAP